MTSADFGYPVQALWYNGSQAPLNYLAFDFEHT
jgi:hypothetical protein